jgi:circadian clock protein KaiB
MTEQNQMYKFLLFIKADSPEGIRAVANSKKIFEKYLKGQYELDVIDINKYAALTITNDVVLVPLLIKKEPLPEIRILGDLSNAEKLLDELLIFL